jgi:hypothetical protein
MPTNVAFMASGNGPQGPTQTLPAAVGGAEPPAATTETVARLTRRERLAVFVEPFGVFVLGTLLVLFVEQASEVSSGLRTPALFAGLFLAGHGINRMQQVSRPQAMPQNGNGARREAEFEDDEPQQRRGSGSIGTVITVVLALWLAWEAVTVLAAPRRLTFTALLAAILLFSDGLRALRAEEG